MNEEKYLEAILLPLVAYASELSIQKSVDEKGILLVVKASKEDMGRIIGKAGTNANAIRALMRSYGSINQQHISVKIEDPQGSPRRAYQSDGQIN